MLPLVPNLHLYIRNIELTEHNFFDCYGISCDYSWSREMDLTDD